MPTPHISAETGDFAKTVLMPGDPLRARFVAENFLEEAKLVTEVRGCLGYTGFYKNTPVSVMASGMGMPSIGIYSYELFTQYEVETIIRIGSAGSYSPALNVLEVCLAESAFSDSSFALVQGGCREQILYPSPKINGLILEKACELGIGCKMAKVYSSDVFYTEEDWQAVRDRSGADCVEMESFALFHIARSLKKNAACLLTISDSFVTRQEISAQDRQNSFTDMIRLALESAKVLD